MKVGGIEGEPEEISEFFDIHDSNLDDYIERPREIDLIWLIFSIVSFLATISILYLVSLGSNLYYITLILTFGSAIWVDVCVHLRFKSNISTTIVGVGMIIMIALSFDAFSMRDILDVVIKKV
jgi:predicted neutral ceramidase superfamily lipid hydrolase